MILKYITILYIISWGAWQVLAQKNEKPNVVIIMADDMGFDDVSFRGGKEFLTPNIDALAYHGKILNRLYAPALCTPSRATLLTGVYPIHTGTQHSVLNNPEPFGILENFTSMAEVFQNEGYSTHLVGKWHLGMGRKEFTPTYNGFDSHYGYWGGFIDYYNMKGQMPRNTSMGYDFRRNLDLECAPEGSYVTDLFTQEAEKVILNNDPQKPLFLLVTHLATHAANNEEPLQAPQSEIEKFNYIPDLNRRTYAAMASKLDESVGKIIKALDKSNRLKNTIILFYSDNGGPSVGLFNNTASNWPLKGQKNTGWEGGVRVAGAIWSPLLKNKASIYQPPIYSADWLPTLAAAANISLNNIPYNLDGLNHWPDLLKSKNSTLESSHKDREILHILDDIEMTRSYMKGNYKYLKGTMAQGNFDKVLLHRNPNITDPRESNYNKVIKNSLASQVLRKFDEDRLCGTKIQKLRTEAQVKCGPEIVPCNPLQEECLYNVRDDPCEQNNLARNPEYGTILSEMRDRVEQLRHTAIEPRIGDSRLDYDPTRHDCTWTMYLEEPVSDTILECDYYSPQPCRE